MLAPSMLGTVEDHLVRMFAHLGPVAAAVLVADIRPGPNTEETGLLEQCPLGQGVLPTALLGALVAEHLRPETPVILLPGAHDGQRAALGL
jgi:hypothetical protein